MKAKMQAAKAKTKAKKAERKYDESQAYNKNLSPEARLHYLENERADKDGASMYGKGPNMDPATMAIITGVKAAAKVLPVIGPPAVKLGKKALSGLETLGAGEGFSKGFNMKNKDAFKDLSKGVGKIAKTDTGKMIKEEGIKLLDKTVKSIGGAKMNGKKKGPNAMGKKEKIGAIAGAIAGKRFGALGIIAGGLAGKAFGKGQDRKEAEEGTGANMMGNPISKHMGGRGANMYGEGVNMMGIGKMRKDNRKDTYEHLENLKDIGMAPVRVVAKAANIVSGDDPQTPKEARQERREERREERQERRAAKAGGPNMEGKKPMMKGENVIVRDAKSGGKKQYNKRGK
jgi:hypothetical protein